MASLYVVGTPIGNLSDISQRALDTLKLVDYILCEDTRVSQKMLTRFGIKKPMISYHQHSKLDKVDCILNLLRDGKNLALISDAGTPGVSDPGGQLVEAVIKEFGDSVGVKIEPIPGPSALTAVASVCGFSMDRFIFLGFPPIKKKRQQFFEEVVNSKYPVIFYESPYRILKTLNEILKYRDVEMFLVVGRELTKKFETIYRGSLQDVAKKIESDKVGGSIKGEFVVVIKNSKEGDNIDTATAKF
ncbi:MAG: 16S rRNA (cytidine(1402)-2'-O)-methyltransferase [Candidatus Pacebacteria bacterium]|nr:16S rRNA (cytidine(1402)-2'-O)-methyltransferase [Candidatus Paceibacterota bacterium]